VGTRMDGTPVLKVAATGRDRAKVARLHAELEKAQMKAIPKGKAGVHNVCGSMGDEKGVFDMALSLLLGGAEATVEREFKCALCGCGIRGVTAHDFKMDKARTRLSWDLCPNHALPWMMRRLMPAQVREIRRQAGGETFHTHGDFYDGKGRSVQPVSGL